MRLGLKIITGAAILGGAYYFMQMQNKPVRQIDRKANQAIMKAKQMAADGADKAENMIDRAQAKSKIAMGKAEDFALEKKQEFKDRK